MKSVFPTLILILLVLVLIGVNTASNGMVLVVIKQALNILVDLITAF